MRTGVKILLVVSLVLNVTLIYIDWLYTPFENRNVKTIEAEVDIAQVRKDFIAEFHKKYPQEKNKKYIFLDIWSPGDWEGMEEMPVLDTLVRPIRNDMSYVFVCKDKPDYAWRRLKEHSKKCANFIYMTEQKDLINSIYQEKGMLNKSFWRFHETPTYAIMNLKGELYYYQNRPSDFIVKKGPKPSDAEQARRQLKKFTDSIEKVRKRMWYHQLDSTLRSIP